MTFRVVRWIVLLVALVAAIAAIMVGTRLSLSAFWSNVVAGVVGSASTVAFGLLVLERYEATRWRRARDAALPMVGLEIGLLVYRFHTGIDVTQYTTYGAWLKDLEPANAAVAANLERRAEAIDGALRAKPFEAVHGLLQGLLQHWFTTAQIDRLRSLAFPLLAGTVDRKAVAALSAIEGAAQYAYYAREVITAVVANEPIPDTDERLVVREMLHRFTEAYRAVLRAVGS